ncbi:MAG: leucine-rich repeat protein [Oscillospiraceae bacterium]|nr:leucine-rich repeat protein [Oscillospiraceae bacterium]
MKRNTANALFSIAAVLAILFAAMFLVSSDASKKQIADLTAELADRDSRIAELTDSVAAQNEQLDTLTAESAESAERIAVLEAGVSDRDLLVQTLSDEAAGKDAQLAELQAGAEENVTRIKTLEQGILDRDTLIDSLTAELSEKDGRLEELTERIEKQGAAIDSSAEELEEAELQLQKLTDELTVKEQENAALAEENGTLRQQLETSGLNASAGERGLPPMEGELSGDEAFIPEDNSFQADSTYPGEESAWDDGITMGEDYAYMNGGCPYGFGGDCPCGCPYGYGWFDDDCPYGDEYYPEYDDAYPEYDEYDDEYSDYYDGYGEEWEGDAYMYAYPSWRARIHPGSGAGRGEASVTEPDAATAGESSAATADFLYVTNGVEILITGYLGQGGDVSIPDRINGLPVTGIASLAFCNATGITSLTLPDSLEAIHAYAFAYMDGLAGTLVLPTSLSKIGEGAFQGSGLQALVLRSDCALGAECFADNPSLEFVCVLDGCAASLGEEAFAGDTALSLVMIPDAVSYIGDDVFYGCENLLVLTPTGSAAEAYAAACDLWCDTEDYETYAAEMTAELGDPAPAEETVPADSGRMGRPGGARRGSGSRIGPQSRG